MFNRRQFLTHTLKGSSLVALTTMVPQFVSLTARAVGPRKDNILVVLELSGGNDGLNTVIPYADDLYHKARPTLRQTKNEVIRLDDHVGLHSGMQGFKPLWERGQLAVVQGVGYLNPNRSHFEAMDIWQSADVKGSITTGWLGRAAAARLLAWAREHRRRTGLWPDQDSGPVARAAKTPAPIPSCVCLECARFARC